MTSARLSCQGCAAVLDGFRSEKGAVHSLVAGPVRHRIRYRGKRVVVESQTELAPQH